MKSALFVLLGVALAVSAVEMAVTDEMVAEINSRQSNWVASTESPMARLSKDEARSLFNLNRADMMRKDGLSIHIPRKTFTAAERTSAPASFDSRTAWPGCDTMKQIRDQSHCGACWAFGAVEAMSDRVCVQTKEVVPLSAEIMNSCSDAGSCEGGWPYDAWQYWVSSGIPSEACRPFSLPGCDHHVPGSPNPCPTNATYPTPPCVKKCLPVSGKTYKDDLHFGASVYTVAGEEDIMTELSTNGPCEVAFDVYDDFLAYTGGIYHHVSGSSDGGHAVKLVGYGTDNGVKYWLIANSWNVHWGEQGFFRIRRGNDECGIEDEVVCGMPK